MSLTATESPTAAPSAAPAATPAMTSIARSLCAATTTFESDLTVVLSVVSPSCATVSPVCTLTATEPVIPALADAAAPMPMFIIFSLEAASTSRSVTLYTPDDTDADVSVPS